MNKSNITAIASANGRGPVTRTSSTPRRHTGVATERAREARRGLKPRAERFAHLKRMHD